MYCTILRIPRLPWQVLTLPTTNLRLAPPAMTNRNDLPTFDVLTRIFDVHPWIIFGFRVIWYADATGCQKWQCQNYLKFVVKTSNVTLVDKFQICGFDMNSYNAWYKNPRRTFYFRFLVYPRISSYLRNQIFGTLKNSQDKYESRAARARLALPSFGFTASPHHSNRRHGTQHSSR